MFEAHGAVEGSPSAQPVISSTPAPSTPAPTPQAPSPSPTPTPQQAVATQTPAAPEAPKWEPNYKFKVMDKEHEIDEFVRSSIKDAETEKKIKELYEKAYGLDVVKPRFNETREKFKQLNETHTGVMTAIQELREHYGRGDFDTFFQKLNIPTEKVLQWVLDKAQYNEMPPEQRQVLDAKRAAEQRAYQLEKQNMTMEQQYEQAVVQAKQQAFQVALERPDVKSFADKFNTAGVKNSKGETLGFADAVIELGEYTWYASQGKVDLTPEQAIQEVMARYGHISQLPAAPQAQPMIPVQTQQAPAPVVPAPKKAAIPNVGGRQTSSVAKSKPRSIEDLKKLAAGFSS